jgi:hypothetical protein
MLHDDAVDLSVFRRVIVERASNVEFNNSTGMWEVASAKTGRILHTARMRAQALAWEKIHYSPTGEGWAELTGGRP